MADGDQQQQQNNNQQQNNQQQQADVWHKSAAPELVGFWQNKGLDLSDPVKFPTEFTDQYRQREPLRGGPADQILRMPKPDSPEADVKAFWNKLGAPADPKEYDFSAIKNVKGETIKPELADVLRASFSRRFVPKETALEIAKDLAKFNEGDEQQQLASRTVRLEQERADLAKSWGPNDKTNKFVAEQARSTLQKALNIPDDKMAEAINAMENAYGYANVMKLFHLVGTKIG